MLSFLRGVTKGVLFFGSVEPRINLARVFQKPGCSHYYAGPVAI